MTRDNHYVPCWYQRGFLELGKSQLCYLNLSPDVIRLPDGRTIQKKRVHWWTPTQCFYETDLYTTFFGFEANDEIERMFFGRIDTEGSKAASAYASGDAIAMHHTFHALFEFLDIQRLRTPKGLDWIKSRYGHLDQLQLMVEMQGLRTMNCTMWVEGVREIVTADHSDIKFIVSDHPVTIYNRECPPLASECVYPGDPSTEWCGTQTVFVLNANTCLILTHLEYAQSPEAGSPKQARTNARYRGGQTLARTDAFIRKRQLSRDDVVAVNFLVKSRARRFLAAGREEWLFPEKAFSGDWKSIASVLLPKDDLWQFGGEIFVGYKDGSTFRQDAFGRTSGAHEYLKRKEPRPACKPNDPCGCGSGRIYKHCCESIPEDERPSWNVLGIRERGAMLCNAILGIVGLSDGKSWDDVRRELSDDHIRRIFGFVEMLWPEDTNLKELLPRPATGISRVVYPSHLDARTVQATVVGWLPYFDEIIVCHPFVNPLGLREKFRPTLSPSQFRAQALKTILLLVQLEPYIRAGKVLLLPDPGDFDPVFRRDVMALAEVRAKGLKMHRHDRERVMLLNRDEFRRSMYRLPDAQLRNWLSKGLDADSKLSVDDLLRYAKAQHENDPFALLQRLEGGEAGSQFMYFKGFSLEVAIYLASLTGSLLLLDLVTHWEQLRAFRSSGTDSAQWASVAKRLAQIEFNVTLNAQLVPGMLGTNRFSEVRAYMRHFLGAVGDSDGGFDPSSLIPVLNHMSELINRDQLHVPKDPHVVFTMKLAVPLGGFGSHEIGRLALTYGRAKQVSRVPAALLVLSDRAFAADS